MDNLGSTYLVEFQAEGEACDTLKEGDEQPIALYVNMALKPEIERQILFGAGQWTEKHQVPDARKPEELARSQELEDAQYAT
jgi:hypothetical protein